MSRKFLVVLLAAVFLVTPAIAGSIGIGQIGRGGIDKPVVGTTGRTSVHASHARHHATINWGDGSMPSGKTIKGPHKSGIHKNTIGDNNSPMPQDR